MIAVGEIIITSSLSYQESQGTHSREDYTQKDELHFFKHTLAYY